MHLTSCHLKSLITLLGLKRVTIASSSEKKKHVYDTTERSIKICALLIDRTVVLPVDLRDLNDMCRALLVQSYFMH